MYKVGLLLVIFFTQLPAMNIERLECLAIDSFVLSNIATDTFSLLSHSLQQVIMQRYIDRFNTRISRKEQSTYAILKEEHEKSIVQGNHSCFELKVDIKEQMFFMKAEFIPSGSGVQFSLGKMIKKPNCISLYNLDEDENLSVYSLLLESSSIDFQDVYSLFFYYSKVVSDHLKNFLVLMKQKHSSFILGEVLISNSEIYGEINDITSEEFKDTLLKIEDCNTFKDILKE